MKPRVRSVWVAWLLVIVLASSVAAQPADQAVSVSHVALLVRNFDEQKRFWIDLLGGTPGWIVPPGLKSAFFVSFPHIMIELVSGPGTGGTAGTTLDHVTFQVRDLRSVISTLRAAGYSEATAATHTRREISHAVGSLAQSPPAVAFIVGPENVTVGFIENKRLKDPLAFHHLHFAAPPSRVHEMAEWYVALVGAKVGRRGQDYESLDLPGAAGVLVFSESSTPVVGTTGRVARHICFHVKDLRALYQRLTHRGLNFTTPLAEFVPKMWFAFTMDPTGTAVALLELLPGMFFADPASGR